MTDFLLDMENGRLFENGDIRTGNSDRQNQDLIFRCAKGSFKQFPDGTVGAADYLENEDPASLLRETRTKFTEDGMTVNKIVVEDNKLKIDANY